jgi:enterochelin esterase-like enzyme
MKKTLLLLHIAFFATLSFAQNSGKVLESLSFQSKILQRTAKFSVYLPADYDKNQRTYPVVYLLHGYSGCELDWIQFGEAPTRIDKAIASGQIPPMIVVMPDAQNTWYVNAPNNNYEDFFIKELLPRIDSTFRTRASKDGRALAGLSMGGNGSFCYAMKYPTLFGACAVMSGSFWPDDYFEERKEVVDRYFGAIYGKDIKNSPLWKANNPFYFLTKEKVADYNSVKIYFDCGDDDFVMGSQTELDQLLRKLKINHELRIRDGVHNWKFWREGLVPALEFCGEVFHH